MEERDIMVPVSSLKEYLKELGITVTVLSEYSGINLSNLTMCINGTIDSRNGCLRILSEGKLKQLQDALHEISLKLKYVFIFYNTDFEEVKQNGNRYCSNCVDQIKDQLSPYFKLLPFMEYALGWNKSKVRNVINNKKSISYGNISQQDVNRINIVLAEIAALLDRITLVKTI